MRCGWFRCWALSSATRAFRPQINTAEAFRGRHRPVSVQVATLYNVEQERAPEIVVPKSSQTKAVIAKRGSKGSVAKTGPIQLASAKAKQRTVAPNVAKTEGKLSVTFGEVSVIVTQPTDEAIQKGVRASAKVIRDLGKRLLTPGVEIKRARDIPVFTADPHNPNRVIRKLNGKSEVGHFVRGEFRVDAVAA